MFMDSFKFKDSANVSENGGAFDYADAGFAFTVAVLISVAFSVVFTFAVAGIAAIKGRSLSEYIGEVGGGVPYNAFAYGLSGISIAVSVLIISARKKTRPLSGLPFKKFKPKYLILGLAITFGMLFGFTKLNGIFIDLMKKIGYAKPDMALPMHNFADYLLWIALIAILPAFTEECLFRGYVAEGLKTGDTAFAAITGGILFSLFHQNPQQTVYQFICGFVLFLIAIKSGSLWLTVIMHFINNFVIITLAYFGVEIGETAELVLTIAGAALFLGALAYLVFFDGKQPCKKTAENEENPLFRTKKGFFIYAFIGIAACVIMWFTDLFTYIKG